MRGPAIPVVVATAAAIANAALAQDTEIGSRLKPEEFTHVEHAHPNGVLFAHYTVRCAVRNNQGAARNYLSATTDAEIDRWDRGLFGRQLSCSDRVPLGVAAPAEATSIDVSRDIKRGMIAEALLSYTKVTLLPVEPIQRVYHFNYQAVSGRDAAVNEMAICVASINPEGIRSLLETAPEAAEETKAISAISPSLGPCLSANTQLSANRESLRAALAEALYQRMMATQTASSANVASKTATAAAALGK